MYHPLNLGIFLAFIAIIGQYLYKARGSDYAVVITTSSGLIMAAMVTVRRYTNPYITLAEQTHISMVEDSDVLITKFGDEVMGTVILGWVDAETKGKRRKWRAEIKGWAVRLRYRGKGEGLALLQEAVNLAKKKDADSISFAPDHASKCLMIRAPRSVLTAGRLETHSLGLLQRTFRQAREKGRSEVAGNVGQQRKDYKVEEKMSI
jgi:hypothetical protein